jgi:hypothetical protein
MNDLLAGPRHQSIHGPFRKCGTARFLWFPMPDAPTPYSVYIPWSAQGRRF